MVHEVERVEKSSELNQATLRLTVSACALLYIIVLSGLRPSDTAAYTPIIVYISTFIVVSIFLRMAIKRWPGHFFGGACSPCFMTTPVSLSPWRWEAKVHCLSMLRCSG